jgi:hypothetical protein
MIPPTVITVNGVSATSAPASAGLHNLDSFLYNSIEEPHHNNVVFNLDLEPIDFEHFVDEPDMGRSRSNSHINIFAQRKNNIRATFAPPPNSELLKNGHFMHLLIF